MSKWGFFASWLSLIVLTGVVGVALHDTDWGWFSLCMLGILSGMGYGYVIGNILGRQGRG